MLTAALEASGLAATLAGPGPYTPTDDALAALPESLHAQLLTEDPARYNLLTYHLVPAHLPLGDFDGQTVRTLNGATLSVKLRGSVATVNRHVVLRALPTRNRILYIVDAALIPPGAQE